jgi:uncharacterized membrane protein YdjX (TVP38/TMEM64 family)
MTLLFVFVESTGMLAPAAFILLHLIRPFLLIPVQVVCIVGGILFGALFGTLYSLIGLSCLSVIFYILFKKMPSTFKKVIHLKEKWLGNKVNFTIGQIAILRLIPIINFHLLSLCIIEITRNFRQYLKSSIITNIPIALFYTVFGQFIREFTSTMILVILLSLTLLFYLLREKQVIIKWNEFFKPKVGKAYPGE